MSKESGGFFRRRRALPVAPITYTANQAEAIVPVNTQLQAELVGTEIFVASQLQTITKPYEIGLQQLAQTLNASRETSGTINDEQGNPAFPFTLAYHLKRSGLIRKDVVPDKYTQEGLVKIAGSIGGSGKFLVNFTDGHISSMQVSLDQQYANIEENEYLGNVQTVRELREYADRESNALLDAMPVLHDIIREPSEYRGLTMTFTMPNKSAQHSLEGMNLLLVLNKKSSMWESKRTCHDYSFNPPSWFRNEEAIFRDTSSDGPNLSGDNMLNVAEQMLGLIPSFQP